MVDKNVLKQYADLKHEINEVRNKIIKLEKQIEKIEQEGSVKDTVKGGNGGIQHFVVEGFPSKEYSRKKTLLYARKTTLELLESDILEKLVEVEQFIATIDDSFIRRIVSYRYVDNMTWVQVGIKMNNTGDNCRIAFERFMQK